MDIVNGIVVDPATIDPATLIVKETAMIALLPTTTDWCQIDLPHMTLVYAGDICDLNATSFNDMAKDAAMISMLSKVIVLRVMDKEPFGPPEDLVDVFRLQPSFELLAMRRAVKDWNASDFPFNPHVTIGPVGTPVNIVPNYIAFDRIMVAWGEENLTFGFGK
jgi:2'-5' RNA ligase